MLTESHDGGRSFAPSHAILETGPPYFGDTTAVSRVEGFPQIALGPRGQTLYVCWSDYTNGDIDVFLSSSSDHGRTWSQPVRVNNDAIHDGKDQFFQWMAVDPRTGAIYVEFYDRRNDSKNVNAQITLARSNDKGKTFVNYAWTKTAFNPDRTFLGDYTWVTAYDNHVYAAWTAAVAPAQNSRSSTTVIQVGVADFSRTH